MAQQCCSRGQLRVSSRSPGSLVSSAEFWPAHLPQGEQQRLAEAEKAAEQAATRHDDARRSLREAEQVPRLPSRALTDHKCSYRHTLETGALIIVPAVQHLGHGNIHLGLSGYACFQAGSQLEAELQQERQELAATQTDAQEAHADAAQMKQVLRFTASLL